jgi:hypothetical protein
MVNNSNSNQNKSNEPQNNQTSSFNQTNTGTTNNNATILTPQAPLVMGYVIEPAQIVITYDASMGTLIQNPTVNVQQVQFICPDIDLAPLYLEVRELKQTLKKTLDSKQLAQDIGNELVGETYLRWDTQVRFYPTITFIFLENEAHFLTENQSIIKRDKK